MLVDKEGINTAIGILQIAGVSDEFIHQFTVRHVLDLAYAVLRYREIHQSGFGFTDREKF